MSTRRYATMMDRLLANSIRVGDCLLWTGPCNDNGYGRVACRVKGVKYPIAFYVHRVAWELARGPIPEGMHLDHLREEGICHYKNCWNVEHLKILTPKDNSSKSRQFHLSKKDREWMRSQGVQSTLL